MTLNNDRFVSLHFVTDMWLLEICCYGPDWRLRECNFIINTKSSWLMF